MTRCVCAAASDDPGPLGEVEEGQITHGRGAAAADHPRRQVELIRRYRLRSNTVVELEERNTAGETTWHLEANDLQATLARPDFELLLCLARAALKDPRRFVPTSELVGHLQSRLPCGAPDAAGVHRMVHRLRRRYLGEALETSNVYAMGYRLSTPNVIIRNDAETAAAVP